MSALARYERALDGLDAPFAFVDLDTFWLNAADLERRAAGLGATEVDVVNDSELVAKQVNGAYKVKHAAMKPLHRAATEVLEGFDRWSVRSVPRAQNAHADSLVNQALDARTD